MKINKELVKCDWYNKLLEDIKKLEFTGIVLTKWNIGKRIVEDELKFSNAEYGSKRIENIAKDLRMAVSDLYACIQFYNKFSDTVGELKDKSWRYIVHSVLPEQNKKL